ncbi:MAG: (deoxy)nucleoside triphosphate pyrophosphohydrolase [Clostridia bacterium]|nr:(deoxy)nucleoside triphosphate pyrophosphohydrolase [Clostridia bacterium]
MNVIAVVAGILMHEGKIMAARRKPGGSESLKWEFPGGKVENGETPEKALERELYEELGIRTETGRIYDCRIRWGEERTIVLLFYFTKLVSGTPRAIDASDVGFFDISELSALDFAAADKEIVMKLAGEMQKR